jgi:hypothetical protein
MWIQIGSELDCAALRCSTKGVGEAARAGLGETFNRAKSARASRSMRYVTATVRRLDVQVFAGKSKVDAGLPMLRKRKKVCRADGAIPDLVATLGRGKTAGPSAPLPRISFGTLVALTHFMPFPNRKAHTLPGSVRCGRKPGYAPVGMTLHWDNGNRFQQQKCHPDRSVAQWRDLLFL